MLGEKFDGAAARDLGLVTRLFGEDTYEAELAAVVDRLTGSAPLALTALKGNFVQAEKVGFAEYIRFEAERHGKLFASRDTKEAFAAYVEKRKPVFEGR
jgi:2-(1,2-epoxy-1,2-dihydrophenyl)acetyl-CoA isomerase